MTQYIPPTAEDLIRTSITKPFLPTDTKWGFVLIRGTYASQARWDKFLSLIKEDARDYLLENSKFTLDPKEPDRDLDLWEALEWTVMENEELLDGASFKVARDLFDVWAKGEIERDAEGVDISEWTAKRSRRDRWRFIVGQQPTRKSFFVWVDEETLGSVVDCDALNNRGKVGGYFVWVVRSGISDFEDEKKERGEEDDEDGDGDDYEEEEEDEDDGWGDPDETNEEGWCNNRQKFRAWDLVPAYASIIQGDWPDGYIERDAEGVINIVNI